jgi:hypothetical protein
MNERFKHDLSGIQLIRETQLNLDTFHLQELKNELDTVKHTFRSFSGKILETNATEITKQIRNLNAQIEMIHAKLQVNKEKSLIISPRFR